MHFNDPIDEETVWAIAKELADEKPTTRDEAVARIVEMTEEEFMAILRDIAPENSGAAFLLANMEKGIE